LYRWKRDIQNLIQICLYMWLRQRWCSECKIKVEILYYCNYNCYLSHNSITSTKNPNNEMQFAVLWGFAIIFIVDTFKLQIQWDILPAKLNETERGGKIKVSIISRTKKLEKHISREKKKEVGGSIYPKKISERSNQTILKSLLL